MDKSMKFRAGDWVEVRSKEEILATLDKNGQLDAMPVMPEMLAFAGKRFQVSKRAHKTCDPVNGMDGRRLPNTVHLEDLRCDGAAHDGCQAGCLLYWKNAWLKRVDGPGASTSASRAQQAAATSPTQARNCTEQDIENSIRVHTQDRSGEITYVCQATRVAAATTHIRWWDIGQYFEDYTSGNVRLSQMVGSFVFEVCHVLATAGLGIGSAVRWLYDLVQRIRGGTPYPWRNGMVPKGVPTPTARLDLKEGEMVRMKSYPEVLQTLDENWRNRGLYFDAEMAPFCGGTYKVLKRVERIIHEGSGKMLTFKTPALILDGVACQARYAKYRKFCPRAYYQYCREIWLERVPAENGASAATPAKTR
jgi:hypothetical protein